MAQQHRDRRTGLLLSTILVGLVALGLNLADPVRAADPAKADTSLKFIPDDAAFYGSMLRNKEQLDAILSSKAFAKFKALPGVQQGVQMLVKEWEGGQLSQLRAFYEAPENRELVALLGDMGSQEIFFYGGESIIGFTELMSKLSGGTTQVLGNLARLQGNPQDITKFQVRTYLDAVAGNLDLLRVPEFVIGFKVSNEKRAQDQLDRLEALLNIVVLQNPALKDRVKREKIGKDSFLTITVDGKTFPWDQDALKEFEEKPGQYDKLIKKLTELQLTVSIGVRDKYLLFAVGGSTAVVSKLGQDKLLADRAEMKPLAKFADKRLTSVGYVSKALLTRIGTTKKDLDQMAAGVGEALNALPAIPEAKKEQIKKDVVALAKDLKKYVGEPGASVGFTFLSDRGQESYSYNYGDHRGVDGTKPLTLLEHVGGNPICAVVGRSKYSPDAYPTLVKWLKVAYGHAADIGLPLLNEEQKNNYDTATKLVFPLLKRFDDATGKLLLPSLADGQTGLVLDAKISSKQWAMRMPASDKPLPMLELALVFGVSDAEKLRKAFGEYRAIVNDAIAKVRELHPEIPEFQVPEPESRKVKGGTLYFYPIPAFIGLDEQVSPNAGLSDKVAVLSTSAKQSERLLAATPLKADSGPLADTSRPLVGAAYLNFPGLIDALVPWLEYGARLASQEAAENGGAAEAPRWMDVVKQAKTAMELLKVFRGVGSITYLEDGVLVTHSETVIRDLK